MGARNSGARNARTLTPWQVRRGICATTGSLHTLGRATRALGLLMARAMPHQLRLLISEGANKHRMPPDFMQ